MKAVAIMMDDQGQASVGEIPGDGLQGLQPAGSVDQALALAGEILSGAQPPQQQAAPQPTMEAGMLDAIRSHLGGGQA